MAESFDAVLAEMRRCSTSAIGWREVIEDWATRLQSIQSAHAAEVAERDGEIRMLHILNAAQAVAITDNADDATLAESRADRAVGLLREIAEWIDGWEPNFADDDEWQPVAERMQALLSEQAGERENGNG